MLICNYNFILNVFEYSVLVLLIRYKKTKSTPRFALYYIRWYNTPLINLRLCCATKKKEARIRKYALVNKHLNYDLRLFINLTLYVPWIVTNYINKPTRCTFCVYLFYNLWTTLHVPTKQSDTFARFVHSCRYSKSWTPDDERNGRSKHVVLYKDCRTNTYRKCILLVCLCNWLRCTVHTMSNSMLYRVYQLCFISVGWTHVHENIW